jgi:hypothetical protein
VLRYQLIATATYLPEGYLVAAASYLRFATVRQASVSVDRQGDLSSLRYGSPSLGSVTKIKFTAGYNHSKIFFQSDRLGRCCGLWKVKGLKVGAGVRRGGRRQRECRACGTRATFEGLKVGTGTLTT